MGKEASIVLRMSVDSEDVVSKDSIVEIMKLLPEPEHYHIIGDQRILTDGRLFPTPNRKSSINFRWDCTTYDVRDCNNLFLEKWQPYIAILKTIIADYGYKVNLDYEITVFDHHYPAFFFDPDFTKLLSDLNIEFSMYFYND